MERPKGSKGHLHLTKDMEYMAVIVSGMVHQE